MAPNIYIYNELLVKIADVKTATNQVACPTMQNTEFCSLAFFTAFLTENQPRKNAGQALRLTNKLYQLACKGLAPAKVLCTFVPLFIQGTYYGLAKGGLECFDQRFVLYFPPFAKLLYVSGKRSGRHNNHRKADK